MCSRIKSKSIKAVGFYILSAELIKNASKDVIIYIRDIIKIYTKIIFYYFKVIIEFYLFI